MAQYSTDFSEYTTSSAPGDWSTPTDWSAPGVARIDAGGGLGSKQLFLDGSADLAYVWDDISGDAGRGVLDVRVKCQLADVGTSTDPRVAILFMAGAGRDGYYVGPASGTVFRLRKVVGATESTVLSGTDSFSTSTWFWIRATFSVSTGEIKAKTWPDSGSEPGTWQIETTDTSITTLGSVGVYLNGATSEPVIDYFSVGTNGDAAPAPGGGGDTATPTPAAGAATVSAAGESLAESTVTAAAGAATVSVVGGTLTVITSSAFKNNTGTVLASLTNVTAWVHNPTTGALVVKLTGQTTNGSGVLTLNDAAIVSATTYRVVYRNEDDGAEGMETVTAS